MTRLTRCSISVSKSYKENKCSVNSKKYHKNSLAMKIGSWNVRTLLSDTSSAATRPERRTALVARELGRLGIDIAALSETRLADEGQLDEVGGGYTFFWKGVEEGENRQHGVGFAIKTDLVKQLTELPSGINKRLMTMRLPLESNRFVTIISAYAPTLTSPEEDKGIFYDELRSILLNVPPSDKIWLCGDFNARVGTDYEAWSCLGKHGVAGSVNDNGFLLLHLCSEFDLVIGNTLFQQSDRKKVTWMHARSKNWHMLDYFITRRRDRQDLRIVSACPSAECWTDHRLIRAKLRVKIKKKARFNRPKASVKLNVSMLNNPDTQQKFSESLKCLENVTDWETFRDTMYKVGKETLGTVKKKHKDWFDENDPEILCLLNEKRAVESRVLSKTQSPDKVQVNELKQIKSKVQKRLRQLENSWWETKVEEIQEASNTGDAHKLYSLIREAYGPRSSTVSPVRSSDGQNLIKDPSSILNRWKEHFDELLNRESNIDPSFIDKIPQREMKLILNEPPSLDEVNNAIDALKLRKAPGKDGITSEMLKFEGPETRKAVWNIILGFWNDESVHQDWRDAIMIVLYKNKGKRDICGNYRGIALLCVVGKVLSRIILTRLTIHISNCVLPESQCGFRAGRSTSDMIFSARQIQEKCREQRVGLYQVFIDLTKAFDTVNRNALWKILGKMGCPDKFVNIIKSFHDDMKVWVSLSGELSDPISVENGVKQGDIPAPTLFAIYFFIVFVLAFDDEDAPAIYIRYRTTNKLFALKRFNAKRELTIAMVRDLLYADDCDLVAHTEADMQRMMDLFSRACTALGLTISLDKTKAMFSPAPGEEYVEPNIYIYGKRIGVVLEFIYLGGKLQHNGSCDKEIDYRISQASSSFSALRERCWSRRGIKPETKIDIYKVIVLAVLLYALETCTLYRKQLMKLERFQQYCLREILNIRWQSLTTNEEVLRRSDCFSITSLLMKSRLRWSGHVARMPDYRIPKQLLYGELCNGTRAHGGQVLRYKDTLRLTLKKCQFDDNWEVLAQNRSDWRAAVHQNVSNFEKKRREYASMKRAVRKKQHHPLIAQSTTFPCHICNRILLTRAGLTNHLKWHRKQNFVQKHSAVLHVHDIFRCTCARCRHAVSMLKPNRPSTKQCRPLVHDVLRCDCHLCKRHAAALSPSNQCQECGKVCKSKGGLKLHQRVHNK